MDTEEAERPPATAPPTVQQKMRKQNARTVCHRSGSRHDNLELRWSLRAIAKYAKNVTRVVVAGYPPDWLSDEVVKVPIEDDPSAHYKHINILNAILKAIDLKAVEGDFLYSSDDHFLCGPMDFDKFPVLRRAGDLPLFAPGEDVGAHKRSLENTRKLLQAAGLSIMQWWTHANTHMDANDAGRVKELVKFGNEHGFGRLGYEPTCLFMAVRADREPVAVTKRVGGDIKLKDEFRLPIEGAIPMFSISDKTFRCPDFLAYMNREFSEPCRYEKTEDAPRKVEPETDDDADGEEAVDNGPVTEVVGGPAGSDPAPVVSEPVPAETPIAEPTFEDLTLRPLNAPLDGGHPDLMPMIDAAFTIFFTGYKERFPHMLGELERTGLVDWTHAVWQFPTPYDAWERSKLPHTAELQQRPGMWNTAKGHYRAIKTGYELGYERILIMEDDVRFLRDAGYVLEACNHLPMDWDILMLDHYNTFGGGGSPPGNLYWRPITGGFSTGAYIINRRAMERLIAKYEEPTVDACAMCHPSDLWLDKRRITWDYRLFASRKPLATQDLRLRHIRKAKAVYNGHDRKEFQI